MNSMNHIVYNFFFLETKSHCNSQTLVAVVWSLGMLFAFEAIAWLDYMRLAQMGWHDESVC